MRIEYAVTRLSLGYEESEKYSSIIFQDDTTIFIYSQKSLRLFLRFKLARSFLNYYFAFPPGVSDIRIIVRRNYSESRD